MGNADAAASAGILPALGLAGLLGEGGGRGKGRQLACPHLCGVYL